MAHGGDDGGESGEEAVTAAAAAGAGQRLATCSPLTQPLTPCLSVR